MPVPRSLKEQVDELLTKIEEVIVDADAVKGRRVAAEQRDSLVEKAHDLKRALDASVYPHPLPSTVFDPSSTRLFGRFAAIALVAQKRIPLADVEHVYGSGVYALYYKGGFADYNAVSNTETPLYVGRAQPSAGAVLIVEQGTALTSRLLEHRRSIGFASSNLSVADFTCRYLVIAAGWDTAPELALRRALHAAGLRYRLNTRPIAGSRMTVDIAFPRARVAVEVLGCFWHGCPEHHRPATRNADFWRDKVAGNAERDARKRALMEADGWVVVAVWEHEDLAQAAVAIEGLVRKRRTVRS